MQRAISAVESNRVPSQSNTMRSNWRLIAAPRARCMAHDPARRSGLAGGGLARPDENGHSSGNGSWERVDQGLAFCRQRRLELDDVALPGMREAQPARMQEHPVEAAA